MKLFLFVFCCLFAFIPLFRCFCLNIHRVLFYVPLDIFRYIKEKKWEYFGCSGIDVYCSGSGDVFGCGKTLSLTHKVTQLYNQYGDSLRYISNYHLENIPYIPLINFNQLLDLGTMENDEYIGTVVCIDEISTVLSHRNFANFPLELLTPLCQQRKRRVYILASAQRWFMIDKLFRSLCNRVKLCKKTWRFQGIKTYDAWEYENAVNSEFLKPLGRSFWFIKDSDYNAYNTEEMISRQSADDFISNDEAIKRKGLDAMNSNINNVSRKHQNKRMVLQKK